VLVNSTGAICVDTRRRRCRYHHHRRRRRHPCSQCIEYPVDALQRDAMMPSVFRAAEIDQRRRCGDGKYQLTL